MNERKAGYTPNIVPLERARRDAAADEWKRSETLRGIGRSGTELRPVVRKFTQGRG